MHEYCALCVVSSLNLTAHSIDCGQLAARNADYIDGSWVNGHRPLQMNTCINYTNMNIVWPLSVTKYLLFGFYFYINIVIIRERNVTGAFVFAIYSHLFSGNGLHQCTRIPGN